ncbi:MAG TPA: glycosyltransferase [Bacteroidia bacterium]|nr:glycosyltransferase [Bacteroidia bacterium]
MQSHLHIISFDIPYPANYGGAIDVFHKIRCLHKQGIKVILHCFEYGNRTSSPELEKLCEKVYYYKRNTSFLNQLSLLPFNVKSRIDKELKQNLLKDNCPILFEVLHTCYLLNHPDFKNRKKLFRHSNIEHEYFLELAKGEKSFLKKLYLKIEAWKLKRFEKQITNADCILSVSETDLSYFKKTYPNTKSVYLPSFHKFDELQCKTGKGDYILYHGNLSISENYNAALWLIKHVFSKINHKIIIAGLNPPQHLIEEIKKHSHIILKQNCTELEMQSLIEEAQIHCLFTEQATGLKLKLLNVLYSGKFVIANTNMLVGTTLTEACTIANTPKEFIDSINQFFELEFTNQGIEKRKKLIASINNEEKTKKLIDLFS